MNLDIFIILAAAGIIGFIIGFYIGLIYGAYLLLRDQGRLPSQKHFQGYQANDNKWEAQKP